MPPPARTSERRGEAFVPAASAGTCGSAGNGRAGRGEDQCDADELPAEEAVHPGRRRAVERHAEQPRRDTAGHRREEEPVVAPERVDLTAVEPREQAEAELDRAQEPVLAEQVRLGSTW